MPQEYWWLGVILTVIIPAIGWLANWYRVSRDKQQEIALEQQRSEFETKQTALKSEADHKRAIEVDAFQQSQATNMMLVQDALLDKNVKYENIETVLRQMRLFQLGSHEWYDEFARSIAGLEEADENLIAIAKQSRRLFESGLKTQQLLITVLEQVCKKLFDVAPIEMKELEEDSRRTVEDFIPDDSERKANK